MRDVVVTEYGVADLRDRTDREVAEALVCVADARFQDDLVADAVRAGKVPATFRVPDWARTNVPGRLSDALRPHVADGFFGEYPFGTELTEIEQGLLRALRHLARKPRPRAEDLRAIVSPPDEARPYLERMGLESPSGVRERVLRSAVLYALASADVIA
jgi:hypothetical protein